MIYSLICFLVSGRASDKFILWYDMWVSDVAIVLLQKTCVGITARESKSDQYIDNVRETMLCTR